MIQKAINVMYASICICVLCDGSSIHSINLKKINIITAPVKKMVINTMSKTGSLAMTCTNNGPSIIMRLESNILIYSLL